MIKINGGLFQTEYFATKAQLMQALAFFGKNPTKRKVQVVTKHLPTPETPIAMKREGDYIEAKKNVADTYRVIRDLERKVKDGILNPDDVSPLIAVKKHAVKDDKAIITRYENHYVEIKKVWAKKDLEKFFEADLNKESNKVIFVIEQVGKDIFKQAIQEVAHDV